MPEEELDMEKAVEKARRDCIVRALKRSHGNKKVAAQLLNMPLRTFQRYCAQLGLIRSLPDFDM
jgi:transcriptional regulator with GAF, ATPase, and Fis domain